MAATIYGPPEGLDPPEFDYSGPIQAILAQEKEYVEKLQEWCRTTGQGDLAGEVWRYPVADGYAEYVIHKTRPLTIIHVGTGDAWNIPEVVRRGLSATLIRQEVDQAKKLAEAIKKRQHANRPGGKP